MIVGPICRLCPHECSPTDGDSGLCRARVRRGDQIVCANYGYVTSMALDPIEKKPLLHFFPGSKILSIGSFGCNLFCPFCQNASISRADIHSTESFYVSPESLVSKAKSLVASGNIGIAFTYNEPLVGYEYVMDAAMLAKKNGLKTVVVTNAYINEKPLRDLLPYIDAMNIDLKAADDAGYRSLGGSLEPVRRSIEIASKSCHVEVTSLIVPSLCDSEASMRVTAGYLATVNPSIPLHVTRFFPHYKALDKSPTPVETVIHLASVAKEYLKFVHTGNI